MIRIVPAAIAGMLAILSVAVMHRGVLLSGFRSLPGGPGDTQLILAVIEHWHRAFLGQQHWLTVPFFHPIANTLGYSESLFLYSIPYSALRIAGADPFLAFQIVLMMWTALGFAGMFQLCRRGLGIPVVFSAVGASIFAMSNGQFWHFGHAQNFGVMLVPLEVFLALFYWRLSDKLSNYGWLTGMALAVLVPLHLFTSYYFGWAFVFFSCLGALLVLGQRWRIFGRRTVFHELRRAWVSHRWQWLAFGGVTGVFLAPFLLTYLPILAVQPRRSYAEVRSMLPSLVDLINVSPDNLVWGRLVALALSPLGTRPMSWELNYGFPPVLLLLFAATIAVFFRRGSAQAIPAAMGVKKKPADLSTQQWVFLLGGVVLLAWLLMLKAGAYSFWRLPYQLVPGAKALRAVSRLQLLLMVPLIAVAILGLTRAWLWARLKQGWPPGTRTLGFALILIFLLAEQINTAQVLNWERPAQLATLAKAKPLPPNCRAFFFVPSIDRAADMHSASQSGASALQTEALQLANHVGIPTIHGYSGSPPPNYPWLKLHPESPDYLADINRWLRLNNIRDGLCTYNPADGSWAPYLLPS